MSQGSMASLSTATVVTSAVTSSQTFAGVPAAPAPSLALGHSATPSATPIKKRAPFIVTTERTIPSSTPIQEPAPADVSASDVAAVGGSGERPPSPPPLKSKTPIRKKKNMTPAATPLQSLSATASANPLASTSAVEVDSDAPPNLLSDEDYLTPAKFVPLNEVLPQHREAVEEEVVTEEINLVEDEDEEEEEVPQEDEEQKEGAAADEGNHSFGDAKHCP